MKKILLTIALMALVFTSAFGAIIEVKPGGGIGSAIKKAQEGDVILLKAGTHTLTGVLPNTKSFKLKGEGKNKTTLIYTGLNLGSAEQEYVFEDLNIVAQRKYLVYAGKEEAIKVEKVEFKNCNIDLSDAACILLNRSQHKQNSIEEINIENCIIFGANMDSHGVVNITKDSSAELEEINIKNSTITNFKRGIILVNKDAGKVEVDIDNVTLYNINHSENSGAIFHCTAGNVEVSVTNSIYHIPGKSPKLIQIDEDSRSIAEVYNSYRTKEQSKLRQSYNTYTINKPASEVFVAPGNNPTEKGVSFKIKDKKHSKPFGMPQIGDLRWNK